MAPTTTMAMRTDGDETLNVLQSSAAVRERTLRQLPPVYRARIEAMSRDIHQEISNFTTEKLHQLDRYIDDICRLHSIDSNDHVDLRINLGEIDPQQVNQGDGGGLSPLDGAPPPEDEDEDEVFNGIPITPRDSRGSDSNGGSTRRRSSLKGGRRKYSSEPNTPDSEAPSEGPKRVMFLLENVHRQQLEQQLGDLQLHMDDNNDRLKNGHQDNNGDNNSFPTMMMDYNNNNDNNNDNDSISPTTSSNSSRSASQSEPQRNTKHVRLMVAPGESADNDGGKPAATILLPPPPESSTMSIANAVLQENGNDEEQEGVSSSSSSGDESSSSDGSPKMNPMASQEEHDSPKVSPMEEQNDDESPKTDPVASQERQYHDDDDDDDEEEEEEEVFMLDESAGVISPSEIITSPRLQAQSQGQTSSAAIVVEGLTTKGGVPIRAGLSDRATKAKSLEESLYALAGGGNNNSGESSNGRLRRRSIKKYPLDGGEEIDQEINNQGNNELQQGDEQVSISMYASSLPIEISFGQERDNNNNNKKKKQSLEQKEGQEAIIGDGTDISLSPGSIPTIEDDDDGDVNNDNSNNNATLIDPGRMSFSKRMLWEEKRLG